MPTSRGLRRAGVLLVAAGSAATGCALVLTLLPGFAGLLGTPFLLSMLALVVLPLGVLGAWEFDRRTAGEHPRPRPEPLTVTLAPSPAEVEQPEQAPTAASEPDRRRFARAEPRRIRHESPGRTDRAAEQRPIRSGQ